MADEIDDDARPKIRIDLGPATADFLRKIPVEQRAPELDAFIGRIEKARSFRARLDTSLSGVEQIGDRKVDRWLAGLGDEDDPENDISQSSQRGLKTGLADEEKTTALLDKARRSKCLH